MNQEEWNKKDIELRTKKLEMEAKRDKELADMIKLFSGIVERIYPEPTKTKTHIIEPEE